MEAELVERKELKRTDTSSFRHHAIAGSFAGVAEHVSVFPIDTIKTHVQAQRSTTATLTWSSDLVLARTLVTQHGVGSLWRGVGVAASACGPAHALMFGTYEQVLTLGGQESAGADRAAVVGAVAGGVSTLAHDMVMVPADTIKQRMQLGYYRSAFHCLSRMLATGGGSLYRSLPTTLAMNVPYASLMMMANEGARKVVNPSGEYSLTTFLLCGGFSGAFAAALTTPLDVVRTRHVLMSEGGSSHFLRTAQKIVERYGAPHHRTRRTAHSLSPASSDVPLRARRRRPRPLPRHPAADGVHGLWRRRLPRLVQLRHGPRHARRRVAPTRIA